MNQLHEALEKVSATLSAFQQTSKLSCLSGCGACCLSPEVEATVFEMLPVACLLIDEGRAEAVYSLCEKKEAGACVLYEKHSLDGQKGQCSVYSARPFICRLFGAYWLKDKHGEDRLSVCAKIRERDPEEATKIESEGPHDSKALLPTLWGEVAQVSAELLGPRYPINLALRYALEKTLLQNSFQKEDQCLSRPLSSPLP